VGSEQGIVVTVKNQPGNIGNVFSELSTAENNFDDMVEF